MDSNQAKGTARNLDIRRLETKISELGWVKPMGFTQVTSTNDVVLENLGLISPSLGIVVIADEQTIGRGRLDRKWSTPPGSGIAMSLGLHASVFELELSAVPLICGVAVHRALASFQIPAQLKWPNDIVFTDGSLRKVGGILVQLVQGNLIIGIGLNVDLAENELPTPQSTSLQVEGFVVDRIELIAKVLEEINNLRTDNNQWLEEYLKICSTIGKNIQVEKNSGEKLSGVAVDVTDRGALVVKNLENLYQVTVGDIVHLGVTAH